MKVEVTVTCPVLLGACVVLGAWVVLDGCAVLGACVVVCTSNRPLSAREQQVKRGDQLTISTRRTLSGSTRVTLRRTQLVASRPRVAFAKVGIGAFYIGSPGKRVDRRDEACRGRHRDSGDGHGYDRGRRGGGALDNLSGDH